MSFFFAVWMLILGQSVFAQESYPISVQEYYSATSSSWQKAAEKSRRVESNDTFFKKGVVYRRDLDIYEYSIPDRKRTRWRRTEDGKTTESERIEIGDDVYTRENGGAWSKSKSSSDSGVSGTGTLVELTQATKQLVSLDGVSAYLYSLFRVERQPFGLLYYETKVWVGLDELRLREERSSGALYPKVENHHEIITYTYDPRIKIEAPIR